LSDRALQQHAAAAAAATYKYALNGVAKVLFCEGDHAGREEGGRGDPVVQPEHVAVDEDVVEGGEPTHLRRRGDDSEHCLDVMLI
jgi:hypothetical protein